MAGDATEPRKRALGLLVDVTEDKRLLSKVLPKRVASLSPEDRARVQRLVTTTLRAMDRADRALGPHLKKRPAPKVMNLLRLGMVEICELGEAPHGVVNSAVAITRSDKKTEGMAGLVNAVLRKADVESWHKLPVPRLPKWLRKPLVDDYGKEIVAGIEAAHYAGAPIDLTAKSDPAAVARAVGGQHLPNGSVRVTGQVQVTALPGYEAGDWWVQDVSASLPARVLAAIEEAGIDAVVGYTQRFRRRWQDAATRRRRGRCDGGGHQPRPYGAGAGKPRPRGPHRDLRGIRRSGI
jgi:16S rRNA (cytosine967-C5)-methyltransferase